MLLGFCLETLAAERLMRDVSELPASSVRALAQGPDDRVWVGTYNGLWVLDGASARRVAPEALPGLVDALALDPNGRVWARHEDGRLVVVRDTPGAPPEPPLEACDDGLCPNGWRDVSDVVVVNDTMYALRNRQPYRLEETWVPFGVLADALLTDGADLYLPTRRALLRVGGSALADVSSAIAIVPWPGRADTWAVATFEGELWRVGPEGTTLLHDDPGRGIALVARGDTLWFSVDRALLAIRGDTIERLGPDQGIDGGGPLLVVSDHSLWLGDFLGAHVFPEPDTRSFADNDGLPSAHARYLVRTGERLWAASWQGIGTIEERRGPPGGEGAVASQGEPALTQQVEGGFCSQGGVAWAGARDMRSNDPHFSLVRLDEDGADVVPDALTAWPRGCAVTDDGTVWLTSLDGLWRLRPGELRPTRVRGLAAGVPAADGDALMVATAESLVRLVDGRLVSEVPVRIQARITSLVRVGAEWWVGTEGQGVLRVSDTATPLVLGGGEPAPLHILGMTPTPEGVWLAGQGTLLRVTTDGVVQERLGAWQGLAVDGAEAVLPRADGGLWLATSWGVVDLPATARIPPGEAPLPVPARPPEGRALTGALGRWSLPAAPNDLVLAYALPAWRAPRIARLRAEIDGTTRSLEGGVVRFVDLASGTHHVVLESSLDGVAWRRGPATEVFVATPWYLRWPFLLGISSFVALALVLGYRLRVAALLQVERERNRIALDLHDEIGSGLAGISALATIAAAEPTPDDARRSLTATIASSAEELGAAMSDIVWSLRKDSGDPGALLALLAERGNRMLSGHDGSVTIDAPASWSSTLSLPVRRALQRIGLEALHNAARHGRATSVVLRLHPGRHWTFAVDDNGSPPTPASAGSGLGLPGMEARARAIGANFSAGPRAEGGFGVFVTFDPRATGTPRGPAWLQRVVP